MIQHFAQAPEFLPEPRPRRRPHRGGLARQRHERRGHLQRDPAASGLLPRARLGARDHRGAPFRGAPEGEVEADR
eukprot:7058577-Alexandrium_andersonii.AAC.1